jgi:flagellar biosynthetic protein FlhB
VAVAGLALAAVDYAFQRRRVRKSVMMTKQEVKEEYRQSEGDPMTRQRIRQRQVEMSRNRMMAAVAVSSVVVVNPTHIAVALEYRPEWGAPRVVAKGQGFVAARIREEAEKHGVPIVRDVPLARTLHSACKLGQSIPPHLYEAVARLLAFVFNLKRGVA